MITLHYRGFILAIKKILASPFEHLLNILTLAVVITVLCVVLVISNNVNNLQKNNLNFPQIVIYLKDDARQNDVSAIEATLNRFNAKIIKNYQFISKAQGLKELAQEDTLKQIASEIMSNSQLPDVLIINTRTANNHQLQMLVDKISGLDKVDEVQMDTNYATKIENLVNFVNTISHLLQIMFSIILVIITYNTIRLQMMLRQDEIIVSRLVGASNGFIMRPLAYYAVAQIIIATTIAVFLVNFFVRYANGTMTHLTSLFGRNFQLIALANMQIIQISGVLIALGIFAVFLAVHWIFGNNRMHGS